MSTPWSDFYALLNVDCNATSSDIKKAYRALSLATHPDHYPDHEKPQMEEKMKHLNNVKDILMDIEKRAAYDSTYRRFKAASKRSPLKKARDEDAQRRDQEWAEEMAAKARQRAKQEKERQNQKAKDAEEAAQRKAESKEERAARQAAERAAAQAARMKAEAQARERQRREYEAEKYSQKMAEEKRKKFAEERKRKVDADRERQTKAAAEGNRMFSSGQAPSKVPPPTPTPPKSNKSLADMSLAEIMSTSGLHTWDAMPAPPPRTQPRQAPQQPFQAPEPRQAPPSQTPQYSHQSRAPTMPRAPPGNKYIPPSTFRFGRPSMTTSPPIATSPYAYGRTPGRPVPGNCPTSPYTSAPKRKREGNYNDIDVTGSGKKAKVEKE